MGTLVNTPRSSWREFAGLGYALLAIIAAFLVLLPGLAQAAPRVDGPHYSAELVAESATPAPGSKVTVAIHITPKAGWHIYWQNPGQSGYPPAIEWTMPAGFTAGDIRHPLPSRLLAAGLVSNVHEGETTLLQDITVPASAKAGQAVNLKAAIDLLICSEGTCVPDPATLDTSVTLGDGKADPAQVGLFAKARAALPQSVSGKSVFTSADGLLRVFIPGVSYASGIKADLFVDQEGTAKTGAAPKIEAADGGVIVSVATGDVAAEQALSGVLRIDTAGKAPQGFAFAAAKSATLPGAAGGGMFSDFLTAGFFIAFGTAILGGLILNLMPCVFPILSLKALALVKYGEDERKAKVEALGYTAGTISTVVALGAVLLLLRSGGSAAGWAFQLQNPIVVGGLLLLVVAIAVNLAGLFELPGLSVSGGQRSGFSGAAATGALAAFVATPCTGPFMAGALGAAMVMAPPAALAVMAGLGIGMALPFLALGFFKPVRRWMPRPGNWMVTLRRVLSLPMFATAIGLAWIIGRQGGVSAMSVAISAALLLGLGLWWYGLRQHGGKSGMPAFAVAVMAMVMVVYGIVPEPAEAVSTAEADALHSEPFSQERLAALTAEGKPVFLYLTADWCLTCKVNEATSLSSADVAAAFKQKGVTVLRGDWTRQDPTIGRFITDHGRAGVPVYLWYAPGGAVQELPQVLNPQLLVDLAGKVTASAS